MIYPTTAVLRLLAHTTTPCTTKPFCFSLSFFSSLSILPRYITTSNLGGRAPANANNSARGLGRVESMNGWMDGWARLEPKKRGQDCILGGAGAGRRDYQPSLMYQ